MRLKIYRLESIVILFIFVCAVLNDLLRIPNTIFSLYRLLLPLAVLLIIINIGLTWKHICFTLFFIIVSVIQNLVYIKVYQYESQIDIRWFLEYTFFYFCIFILFMLMHILHVKDKYIFDVLFTKGVFVIGIMCMLLYICSVLRVPDYIDNQNNYGCCLAAVFPYFLICALSKRNKVSMAICAFILAELLWGDSKSALMGVLVQLGIIGSIYICKKVRNGWKAIYILIPVVVVMLLCFVLSPVTINGYPIKEMFINLVSRVIKGETYPESIGSMVYRTNSMIHLIDIIKTTYCMGVGPGNTSKLLGYLMPKVAAEKGSLALSPHNSWLEFISDCGIWALILLVVSLGYGMGKVFKARKLDDVDIFITAFIISFPLWSLSASGMYTVYLVFIAIAWMFEKSKERKEKWKKQY